MYGVSGEVCWREREGCGERNGGSVVNCVKVWGPNTLPPTSPHSPHLSLHLPLPPPHPNTLCYTSSHTSSDISPSSPHTPTHFPTPIATSPSPSQSVAKLPCDEVSVAKLLWRSYWQPRVHYIFIIPVYFLPKGLATGIFYAILRAFVLNFRLWKALCKDINIKE